MSAGAIRATTACEVGIQSISPITNTKITAATTGSAPVCVSARNGGSISRIAVRQLHCRQHGATQRLRRSCSSTQSKEGKYGTAKLCDCVGVVDRRARSCRSRLRPSATSFARIEARKLPLNKFPGPILVGIIAWPELAARRVPPSGRRPDRACRPRGHTSASRREPKLCPSAQPDIDGADAFGVVEGTRRVAARHVLRVAAGRSPTSCVELMKPVDPTERAPLRRAVRGERVASYVRRRGPVSSVVLSPQNVPVDVRRAERPRCRSRPSCASSTSMARRRSRGAPASSRRTHRRARSFGRPPIPTVSAVDLTTPTHLE